MFCSAGGETTQGKRRIFYNKLGTTRCYETEVKMYQHARHFPACLDCDLFAIHSHVGEGRVLCNHSLVVCQKEHDRVSMFSILVTFTENKI